MLATTSRLSKTVLWMRILDRLASANRPKLVVIDPRTTETAQAADVHLAPRLGTNMALLNGLQHLLVAGGHVDRAYVNRYTVGLRPWSVWLRNGPRNAYAR